MFADADLSSFERGFFRRFISLMFVGLSVAIVSTAGAQDLPPDSGLFVSTEEENANEEKVVLKVSEQQVISAAKVRSYSEGTRGIVDVRLTRAGDQFVLVGLKPGRTTLLLMMQDSTQKNLRIEVTDADGKIGSSASQTVEQQDNIRLDFYFVQLNRSDSLQVGLGYPKSITAATFQSSFDFLTQRFESATAVVQDQALLRLDMAQAGGYAKLMRKAALITENGQRTKFSGGGEVNIPLVGSLSNGIFAITYGSTIEVLPRYDSESGRIQIALAANVSDLTEDRGAGAPGRLTSTLNTVVNLELGQAVVLAGLSSESHRRSRGGLPILSQIPILGWLFGNESRADEVFDNVIFIVPTVVDATTKDARERIKAAFAAYQSYNGKEKSRTKVRETWEEK